MKKVSVALCALLAALAVLTGAGCSSSYSDNDGNKSSSLTIAVTEQVSRSILPSISMDPASYRIAGTGPKGATFEQTTSGANVTVNGLAFGEWTVVVTALNADGIAIGQGSGTVTVSTNRTSYIMITVRPFDGFGTLDLGVTWPAEQVQTAAIESTLTPYSGSSRNLAFTVNGAAGTAAFSANDVAAGYHTLVLKLLDNDFLAMGAVEVVRVVADQTTSGMIVFENVNSGRGSIEVGITPDMRDPLDVSITGAEQAKPKNQSQSLHASVSNYAGNITYVWYVNATAVATGQDFTFDSSWDEGYYRIDVTAFTIDGTRAGSSSATVTVSEAVIGTNATLTSLTVNNGTLTPVFDSTTTAYAVTVPNTTTSITITGVASDPEATISANNGVAQTLSTGTNAITLTVTAADGVTTLAYTVTVTREEAPPTGTFTTVWQTSNPGESASNQICLPLEYQGVYNFTVDWGDGTSNVITAWNAPESTHTYTTAGQYEVKITGVIRGFSFATRKFIQPSMASGDSLKIIDIKEWGPLNLGNNGGYFQFCSNMTISATDKLNLVGTSIFSFFFRNCTALTEVPGINNWDVSKVTNMRDMFSNATSFNQDIGNWNVSNVSNMSSMFWRAHSFNQNIGNWNVSYVTDMQYMFYEAKSFNQEIGKWDVSNVANMSQMFWAAAVFNGDIGYWNVSNVINMSGMFGNTTTFNQNIGNWNVSNVTNMSGMFNSAIAFNQDIGDWDVSNVINMDGMFGATKSFNQDIGNWDVSKVTSMVGMFSNTTAFNQNIGKWDVSNVANMGDMFRFASAFNQNIGNWDVSNVTNMWTMFNGATAFNQDIGNWDVSKVKTMERMFYDATAFNQDIGNWNVSNVTNMSYLFFGAKLFNQDIGRWDVSNVTNMSSMFYMATTFNKYIGNWDVSNVTNMSSMFVGASSFNQDIGNWDVSNVINMYGMFSSATSFNQNIGKWDVSKVTTMYGMFYQATSFNQVIGNWDVSNVTTMNQMFWYAKNFNQDIRNWNVSKVNDMYGMLVYSNLSTANYNALLIGWSNLPSLQQNVRLGASPVKYSSAASAARQKIISDYGWTIQDGGLAQ